MDYDTLPRSSYELENDEQHDLYEGSHMIPMHRMDLMAGAASFVAPEAYDDATRLIDPRRLNDQDTSYDTARSTLLMAPGVDTDDIEHGSRASTPGPAKPGLSEHDPKNFDHFVPLPSLDHIGEEKHPLTVRALFVGCLLGAVINAAMLYAGMFPMTYMWT
jgi:hypothetical protein